MRLLAFLLVAGVLLSPVRAVAAAVSTLLANNVAATATRSGRTRIDGAVWVRAEREEARTNTCDAASIEYDARSNLNVVAGAGLAHPNDGHLLERPLRQDSCRLC